ncbi:MAG TPA: DNRLRE domain-containing protein [Puia sp.]|jgi:hypothetical protein|nr:DNRLRE domain-containing protein [Puia sp.]
MKTSNLLKTAGLSLAIALILVSCQKTNTQKPPVVTAGPSQTITLPADSAVLSGYATDSSSAIVSYLWSEITGPSAILIQDEGSKTAVALGLVPGTYVFQLMATDAAGLTGVDTMTVTMTGPGKNTNPVLLAPVHSPYDIEYIGSSTWNPYEGQYPQELGAEAWTINSNYVAVRSAFRFDLSQLSNTAIGKAQLSLYSNPTPFTGNLSTPNYGSSNQFYISRIATSWDPTQQYWSTQASIDSAGQVLIPQTNQSSQDLLNIDVTQMVKNMIANGNNGFEMRLQNEVIYNSRIFCSSSYSDSTKVPTLYITY